MVMMYFLRLFEISIVLNPQLKRAIPSPDAFLIEALALKSSPYSLLAVV